MGLRAHKGAENPRVILGRGAVSVHEKLTLLEVYRSVTFKSKCQLRWMKRFHATGNSHTHIVYSQKDRLKVLKSDSWDSLSSLLLSGPVLCFGKI